MRGRIPQRYARENTAEKHERGKAHGTRTAETGWGSGGPHDNLSRIDL